MTVTRPVLRYHGGKWRLAPWVLEHFPEHRVYVEPFAGGASVLMRKPRSYAEIYNDLDSEVVNVFRVLQDPTTAAELERLLALTPFAREEFHAAYEPAADPVEQARRTVFKSFAGFGSDSIHRHSAQSIGFNKRVSTWKAYTGFRSDSNRSGTTPAKDWSRYPALISAFCARLQGVVIENRPAIDVIRQYDYPNTLHYVDPPYVTDTRRDQSHGYRHEMTDSDHREIAEVLRTVRGMVVISGYPSALYDRDLYPDWRRIERDHRTHGAHLGTEVLWLSPNVPVKQHELFQEEQG